MVASNDKSLVRAQALAKHYGQAVAVKNVSLDLHAGEIVGLYYGNYTGATSVLKGIVFGRLAGLHAASLLQPA
jgi:ABC-type branched-subunit amino acid transport system ATPase component